MYIPEILYRLLDCRIKHDLRYSKRDKTDLVWTHCIDADFVSAYSTRTYTFSRTPSFIVGGNRCGDSKLCLCNTKCRTIAAVHVAEDVVVWVGLDCRDRFFRFDRSLIAPEGNDESFHTFEDILSQFSEDYKKEKRARRLKSERSGGTDDTSCNKKRRVVLHRNGSDCNDLDLSSDEDW